MLYTLEASSPNLQKQVQDIHAKVLGKRNVVILLFAHWCGHCQMFMGGPDSTWAKLVKQYRTNPNVDLIQLEDTVYSQMRTSAPVMSRALTLPIQLSQMGIQGFPTLAFIYPRSNPGGAAPFRIYDDNRSLESCKLFIDQGILRSGAKATASAKPASVAKPKSASAKPKPAAKPKTSSKAKPKPKPKPKSVKK